MYGSLCKGEGVPFIDMKKQYVRETSKSKDPSEAYRDGRWSWVAWRGTGFYCEIKSS